MSRNKVCHITSAHPSHDVRILRKECISLAKNGFEVYLVVAGAKEEVIDGVKIISVEKDISRRGRMIKTARRVYEKAAEIDADIYHFHDPELLPYGKKLRRHGKIVIYDAHEDVPRQILDKIWIPAVLRKSVSAVFERYENSIVRKLSGVVTATPHIRDRFIKVNKNCVDVNNFPILDEYNKLVNWTSRKNQIVYVGGLFKTRGLIELVAVADKTDYEIHIAGNFESEAFRTLLTSMPGWKKIKYHGFIDREEIAALLYESKIGMVTLHPTQAYLDSLPVKMFEYMACGLAVVISDFPLWKSIIEEAQCGIAVDPQNADMIAGTIESMMKNDDQLKMMGASGQQLVHQKYSWKNESEKLKKFYHKLLA